jgi:hypothetical protein
VLREGTLQGTAGPWQFTLAETESIAPKVGGSGVAMKTFELCFADDAQPEIRTAYLRARKPRSLRTAGIAFEGNHQRTATISLSRLPSKRKNNSGSPWKAETVKSTMLLWT